MLAIFFIKTFWGMDWKKILDATSKFLKHFNVSIFQRHVPWFLEIIITMNELFDDSLPKESFSIHEKGPWFTHFFALYKIFIIQDFKNAFTKMWKSYQEILHIWFFTSEQPSEVKIMFETFQTKKFNQLIAGPILED